MLTHPLPLPPCRLYRIEIEGDRICRVPDDAPPLDRHDREVWPPGWGPGSGVAHAVSQSSGRDSSGMLVAAQEGSGAPAAAESDGALPAAVPGGGGAAGPSAPARRQRVVRTQRDVFELLGLPYREPWQRDC
jgi:hypothetical protein